MASNPDSIAKPGQAFVAMSGMPQFTDDKGKPVDPWKLLFHKLILSRIGQNGTIEFLLEGKNRIKLRPGGNVMDTAGLVPLLDDEEERDLQKKYLGHRVWPYGHYRLQLCSVFPFVFGGLTDDPSHPILIVRIFHLKLKPTRLSLYGPDVPDVWEYSGPTGSDPKTVIGFDQADPFLILYAPVRNLPRFVGSTRNAGSEASRKFSVPYNLFAGKWHLQRTYSLAHPSRTELSAIRSNTVSPGETHVQVAWTIGWPPRRESLDSLCKLAFWNYPMPSPFSYSVKFEGDRVVQYNPPRELP